MTIEQRIQVARIISKSSKHSLPYVLQTVGMKYTPPDTNQNPVRWSKTFNSGIVEFLNQYSIVENKSTNEVYKAYCEYCKLHNIDSISNIEFSKQVKRILRVEIIDKKIQGIKYRMFVKGDD